MEATTIRTRQMPPPGFCVQGRKVFRTTDAVSGAETPGVAVDEESDDIPGSLDVPKRRHKKISPGEATPLAAQIAKLDQRALNDAEELRRLMRATVFGGPLCLDEEFSDRAIRFAHPGLGWIRMAQKAGISATNRRFRGELRARLGYGHLKPTDRTPLFSPHEEFGRAKAQYVETPTNVIAEHRSARLQNADDWMADHRGVGHNAPCHIRK